MRDKIQLGITTLIFVCMMLLFQSMMEKEQLKIIRDVTITETMKLKVDSMRMRNRDYFLLTLHLNNITNDYVSSKRAKRNNQEVQRLMDVLND